MQRPFSYRTLAAGMSAFLTLLAACAPAQQNKPAPEAKPTFADVAYGPAERNVLDFYQAPGERPAPLLIHIHGGGFVGGDKKGVNAGMVESLKAAGIHFASINYRFVDGKDVLFPAPQLDGARAVQFLRSKAKE